jgi:hypothetical protein
LTGWPAPKRILPGRIFIDLSFRDFVGVVLVLFLAQTTHPLRHSGMRLLAQASDVQLHIGEFILPVVVGFRARAELVIGPRFARTRWHAPE